MKERFRVFRRVLEQGTVSTNVYVRRIHDFAMDMSCLPWPVIPRKRWPAVRLRDQRAMTHEEHERILAREPNAGMRAGPP